MMTRAGGHVARIVITGGGVAALEVMVALRRLAGDRVAIVLLTPERDLVHRATAVAEPFSLERARRFDLATLTATAGAELVSSELIAVDPGDHRVVAGDGAELAYDALVVASGARPRPALPGAITFWGIADTSEIARLIDELANGGVDRVAFAAHADSSWQPPLYELALLTSADLRRAGAGKDDLVLVTHEAEPLEILGPEASAGVGRLLEQHAIGLVTGRNPVAVRNGALETLPEDSIPADRVVTLPRLEGPRVHGLPADELGFIPVDSLGRVRGAPDVYAAGDVTAFAVKQCAIAAQQAYTVATAIAAAAGASVDPEPFRPVLHGSLLTDREHRPASGSPDRTGEGSESSPEVLWQPRDRVAGRFLAPYLAEIAGESIERGDPSGRPRMPVRVELPGPPRVRAGRARARSARAPSAW